MAFIVALAILTAGICSAVLCFPDDILGRDTLFHEDQVNRTQMNSLTLTSINNDFAFSLYKELALKNPDKNIVFSPLSISAALAIVSLGAKGNTLQEILEGLRLISQRPLRQTSTKAIGNSSIFSASQRTRYRSVSVGSAIFIEKSLQILAEFKETVRSLYQTEAFTADFQQADEARKFINDYVRKETQGKIQELISDLDEMTSMVLVNYIYFKGKWKIPFNPRVTFESEFYLDEKRSVKVPMMKIKSLTTPYFWDKELSCSVVELKYIGNASALFILPDRGRMQQVEASLQPETLRKWKDSLRLRKIGVLYLPKFLVSTDYSLEDILPELGIREVFSTEADLSRITGAKDLSVSQMVHKAVLDVAETGTEAAAATGANIVFRSRGKPVWFNRPFLMFISRTDVHTTLFMAKVTNPKQT
ncbi:Serine protease inhibitor A3C [Apodemus speciosus]|uniref:Serine protease inhibitor A3C n=1 Tax=Apodemus speciosus TaxID=105296 RepID=A0ABQ0FEW9_APOSI